MAEWEVVLKDHHEGYIDWAEFDVLVLDVRDEALAEGRPDMLAQHEPVEMVRGLQCIATYSRS